MSTDFTLKSPAACNFRKRATLTPDALGQELTSSYENPSRHLVPMQGCFIYMEYLLFKVFLFIHCISCFSAPLLQLLHQHWLHCLTPYTMEPTSAVIKQFLYSFFT